MNSSDRGLHSQIEDLLTALSKLQHQQMEMARDLQKEREEREEEQVLAMSLLKELKKQRGQESPSSDDDTHDDVSNLIERATERFAPADTKRISIIQTKHQLRDAAAEWKEKHDIQAARCQDLMRRLDDREAEQATLREDLRDARQRVASFHKDKDRLQRQMTDLKQRSSSGPDSPAADVYTPVAEKSEADVKFPASAKGLREFRLGKSEAPRAPSIQFNKRSSSLLTQSVIAAANADQSQSHESLLLELVNAKTAEAVARQELEETRGKLDALRKILGGVSTTPSLRPTDATVVITPSTTPPASKTPEPQKPVTHAPSSSVGGFFSGWGKRS